MIYPHHDAFEKDYPAISGKIVERISVARVQPRTSNPGPKRNCQKSQNSLVSLFPVEFPMKKHLQKRTNQLQASLQAAKGSLDQDLAPKISLLFPSLTKLISTAGRSGPLSFPRPCASARTAPARCGRKAEALQR